MLHSGTRTTDAVVTALALSSDHNRIAYAVGVSQGILSHSDSAGDDESPNGKSIGILEYNALKESWEKHDGLVNTINSAIGSISTAMDGNMGAQAKLQGSESFLNSLETLRKKGQDEYDLI